MVLFVKKGLKYFICHKDGKTFDEIRYMLFLIKEDKLLEKYNGIWVKVSNSIKKGTDNEPVYNEKYLKTKTKSFKGRINADFHSDKIPRDGSQFIYLSVVLINSVYRADKSYYPQVFLEEYKYVVKEKTMSEYNTDNIEISSGNSYEKNFDEENSNKEKSNE